MSGKLHFSSETPIGTMNFPGGCNSKVALDEPRDNEHDANDMDNTWAVMLWLEIQGLMLYNNGTPATGGSTGIFLDGYTP